MRTLLPLSLTLGALSLLSACTQSLVAENNEESWTPSADPVDSGLGVDSEAPAGDSEAPAGDSEAPAGDSASAGDSAADSGQPPKKDRAAWTFLVYMAGDNDLESLVTNDLNELEAAGSSDDLHILVLADRTPGYDSSDGDWTGTRLYYIEADSDPRTVRSTVVDDLGELNMGDPQTLSDILLRVDQEYPAEHFALSLWDHGDSWSLREAAGAQPAPPPSIADDISSNDSLSIADGELIEGFAALVERRGPLDLVAFDACNMASWEVAHSMKDQVRYMVASEAVVYSEGMTYDTALSWLHDNIEAGPAELGEELVRRAVQEGLEHTWSLVDLGQVQILSEALDDLAGEVLEDDALWMPLLEARDEALGADWTWKNWYLDLQELALRLQDSSDSPLAEEGLGLQQALEGAVLSNYTSSFFEHAGGLTLFFSPEDWRAYPDYQLLYLEGEGATWSQDTRWDELMLALLDR